MAKGKGAKKGKAKKAKGAKPGPDESEEEASGTEEPSEEPSESEDGPRTSASEAGTSEPVPPSEEHRPSQDTGEAPPPPKPGSTGDAAAIILPPPPPVRATLQPDPADDSLQSQPVPGEPKPTPVAEPEFERKSEPGVERPSLDEDGDPGKKQGSLDSEALPVQGADAAIASVAAPLTTRQIVKKLLSSRIGTKKLVDIINPKKEPLPVDLPPISDIRKQAWIAKGKSVKGSRVSLTATASAMMKAATVVPFIQGDDAPNPFHYPASIEDFIAKNDADRLEDRRKAAKIPPLMKGTTSYKQSQLVLERIKPFIQTDLVAGAKKATSSTAAASNYKQIIWRAQNGLHVNHLQKVSRKLHTEYILQRKGVYYLRRAIRARKIALEMIAKTREFEETCLKDYEWLTDFTKEAFETFLKENDDKTHDAAKAAEDALKEKLDLTLQVRQMNIALNQIKSEIISTNESLRECKAYMRFLDDIATEVMKKDEEAEIRAQHRELQVKEELMVYLKQGIGLKEAQELVEEKAKAKYEEYFADGKHRASFGTATSSEFLAGLQRDVRRYLGMPEEILSAEDEPEEVEEMEGEGSDDDIDEPDLPLPDDDDEDGEIFSEKGLISPKSILSGMVIRTKSRLLKVIEKQEKQVFEKLMMAHPVKREIKDEEDADGFNEHRLLQSLDLVPGDEESDRRELASLSFTRPSQLLQIYTDMEESNLSLIQHSQASEENLERVNYQILNTRRNLNNKGKALREEITRIQANIDINEERANALAMLVEMFTGGNYDVRQQQKLYKILQKHVARVYRAAVGTTDHHLNPIMMLTSIEKNFEDIMQEIQAMPTDVVIQISRELDKERREMERLMKMGQRKKVQEERKSRQLDRAKAPIPRRKGRQLLPRSRPPKVVIQLSQAEIDKKAEEDEFNYFFGP